MARLAAHVAIDRPADMSREELADFIFDAITRAVVEKGMEQRLNTRTLKLTFRDRGQKATYVRKDSTGNTKG